MAREMHVTVEIDGTSKIDMVGFQGAGCAEASKDYEMVLSGGDVSKKKKPDYYATVSNGQKLQG